MEAGHPLELLQFAQFVLPELSRLLELLPANRVLLITGRLSLVQLIVIHVHLVGFLQSEPMLVLCANSVLTRMVSILAHPV